MEKRDRGRPRGAGAKPEGEKFVAWTFRLPPVLLARFRRLVPENERARLARRLIEQELDRREGKP